MIGLCKVDKEAAGSLVKEGDKHWWTILITLTDSTCKNHHYLVLPRSRCFTANSVTMAAVLPKGRSSTANSGTKVAVLLGMNRCNSFPLLYAPHSLFSIWMTLKDLKRIQGHQRGDESGFGQLGPLVFTTGVKYKFHQGRPIASLVVQVR